MGLPGAGAEFDGDAPPRVQVWRRAGQMQDDAADRADDLDAELEQPVPQPRHLGSGARGVRGAQPQFLHQHVGRRSQQHAELVGPEPAATRAVDLQAIAQFLDPVLDVAAAAVDLVVRHFIIFG